MGASLKPPSFPDCTHPLAVWRVRMAQHSPQMHLSIAPIRLAGVHRRSAPEISFLHLPLPNDPHLAGQRKLPVPTRSSSSGGPFRLCSHGLPRVGTGSEWALLESPLLLHLLLKVDSEKSHRSPTAEDHDMRGKSNKHPKVKSCSCSHKHF